MSVTLVSSLIFLLDEPNTEIKIFALRQLLNVVDEFWHQISEVRAKLEVLYEDKSFEAYKLAALLLSKVYFHLGSLDDSLKYALHAEELFAINSRTEYVETLLGKCIDSYIETRCSLDRDVTRNEKITILFNRLFLRSLNCGEFQSALGLALESRRLDMFKLAITESNNIPDMLTYAYTVSTTLIQERAFKIKVIRYLAKIYNNAVVPDYFRLFQCLIFLKDDFTVVDLLLDLILPGVDEEEIIAYQMAFDLNESATRGFLELVRNRLTLQVNEELSTMEDPITISNKIKKLLHILSGRCTAFSEYLFLKFNNKTDKLILDKTMEMQRKSVSYTGTVIAYGFMHSGTNDDRLFKDNLQWVWKAKNWEITTAIASLGVINRGEIKFSLQQHQNIINNLVNESGYMKGGFLYSLGLIYANQGKKDVVDYLVDQLKNAENEKIRHGGCLSLGLAAMETNREDLYEQLKSQLYLDEACTGEAAGIAMGMVMVGSNNESAIEDMVLYAQESQHEKILRGLSVGIALVKYGRFEEADALIERLEVSSDAILRRAAMYTVAMAYSGSGNTKAVRKFLHVAISDVDDDVRRAAVTGLGFLLFKTPQQCPNLLACLTESYNPHVRYGATMALGIACAGTGMLEALDLLKLIIEFDQEDFVRQGAFIASAMILMQHNERTCPQVNFFRQSYADTIENRYEKEIAKFGAILAQGIIDAGGRNVTLSLQSRTGHTNMISVVGILMFTQYWYWFPFAHCLSLAFTPTYLIALNSDLIPPTLIFKSNVEPGLFAYPPPLEDTKEEKKIQVKAHVLSQTKRKKDKKSKKADEKLDVAGEPDNKNKKKIGRKQRNSTFELLNNPVRVLKNQLKFISIDEETRYVPVRDITLGGVIMVRKLQPSEEKALIENSSKESQLLPKPFQWLP